MKIIEKSRFDRFGQQLKMSRNAIKSTLAFSMMMGLNDLGWTQSANSISDELHHRHLRDFLEIDGFQLLRTTSLKIRGDYVADTA